MMADDQLGLRPARWAEVVVGKFHVAVDREHGTPFFSDKATVPRSAVKLTLAKRCTAPPAGEVGADCADRRRRCVGARTIIMVRLFEREVT
jgi:hypothetical protein